MNVRQLIINDEGWRTKAYQDTEGNWTIGVGHLLSNPIPDEAVEIIFRHDLADIEQQLFQRFPWMRDLDEVRQAVFINVAFNLGVAGLAGFRKTLGYAEQGYWLHAASELLDSDAARKLPQRYRRLAEMLRSGEWPNRRA